MSLLFYASNDWKNLPILLLSLLFDYLVCSKLVRFGSNQKGRRTIFWSSILKNILLMVLAMAMMELGWITMPLGLLVYTVTSMGYVIDVYNGDERFDGKIMDYLLFTCFCKVVCRSDCTVFPASRAVGKSGSQSGKNQYRDEAVCFGACKACDSGRRKYSDTNCNSGDYSGRRIGSFRLVFDYYLDFCSLLYIDRLL